jgi:hypothetical protein
MNFQNISVRDSVVVFLRIIKISSISLPLRQREVTQRCAATSDASDQIKRMHGKIVPSAMFKDVRQTFFSGR